MELVSLSLRKQTIQCEISGSHSSEYEDYCLLDCCAMYHFYQTTWHNNPEPNHATFRNLLYDNDYDVKLVMINNG
jgi:hypothetical protein